jgi:hypothetical protein
MSGRRGVHFDNVAHVREHIVLDRQLSDRPPQADPHAERGPDGVGTYRKYLSFEIAREYDMPLRTISYELSPATTSSNHPDAYAAPSSASAASSASSMEVEPSSSVAPHAGAHSTAAAPSASSAAAPAATAAASSAAVSAKVPRRIDGWHIKEDACIYQGPSEHSSPIGTINGNIVTTRSGNAYQLGALDPQILAVVRRLQADDSTLAFDEQNPLARHMHMPLLYAERIVYGGARAKVDAIRQLVAELEESVGFPEVVGPQFAALRSVFNSLGLDMSRPAAAAAAAVASPATATAAAAASSSASTPARPPFVSP